MAERWDRSRELHRSEQASSIVAAALALVAEHGSSALTMAAIAQGAGISRQTLYRYFKDVDAVLVGIADLVSVDVDDIGVQLDDRSNPRLALDLFARAATSDGHGRLSAAALEAVLPPSGREVIAQHEARACALLAQILRRGVDDGSFRSDLQPELDAGLILGLLAAAGPSGVERAIAFVHHIVEPRHPQPQTEERT